jgi:DNA-binding response OmpR family regulator
VAIATVFLVGIDELDRVPEYLDLGAVVVIAPDQHTLHRWQAEQSRAMSSDFEPNGGGGVVLDLPGRRVLADGEPLQLSDLEFRVLAVLLSRPGSAWTFHDLRRTGWGDSPELPIDAASVRSLIQRLRVKLRAAEADVTIRAVRGYGFRLEEIGEEMRSPDGAVCDPRSA